MSGEDNKAVIAAILLSAVGVSMLLMLPIFIGTVAVQYGFGPEQLGQLALLELGGGALASILAVFWINRVSWHATAYFAVIVVIIGNLVSTQLSDFTQLATARFLVGLLGQGTAFALAIAAISSTSNPDRNFGLSIAAQVALSVAGLLGLSQLTESYGVSAIMVPLAILAAVVLTAIRWLPARSSFDPAAMAANGGGSILLPLAGLLAMIIWCTGLGAVWAFLQQIAGKGGIELAEAGSALALSSGIAIIGALTATALGGKLGRMAPVGIALLVQTGMIWMLQGEMGWFQFAATCAVFQIFWNVTGPFMMGAIASSDTTGRISVLIPAAQTGGFAVGPGIAGGLMAEGASLSGNLLAVNYVGMVCCLLALVIFVPLAIRLARPAA